MPAAPILQTAIARRAPDKLGKVRDIYEFGDRLLIVATDRISAFDYVLGSGIPDKGKVLTQISAFWFERTKHLVDNHVLSTRIADYPKETRTELGVLKWRYASRDDGDVPLTVNAWPSASGGETYVNVRCPMGARVSGDIMGPAISIIRRTRANKAACSGVGSGAAVSVMRNS